MRAEHGQRLLECGVCSAAVAYEREGGRAMAGRWSMFGLSDSDAIGRVLEAGEAVRIDEAVTRLVLAKSRIGAAGAARLADALEHNDSVQTLVLTPDEVGDYGAGRLAEALMTNSALKTLYLSRTGISDDGAGRLAEALTVNTSVTAVYLSHNSIGFAGAGRLAEALRANRAIKTLYLQGNDIGPGAKELLQRAWGGRAGRLFLESSCHADSHSPARAKVASPVWPAMR